jgi:hypothetical protein
MLRYLWEDYHFADGATARSLVTATVGDHRSVHGTQQTQQAAMGGLRAAAGTLGAGSMDNVRLAFIQLLLRAAGLARESRASKVHVVAAIFRARGQG